MSKNFEPWVKYIDKQSAIRQHFEDMSQCRAEECPVPKNHPYYPVTSNSSLKGGGILPNPSQCLPVVPTRVKGKKVMILGMYPTAKFATVQTKQGKQINEIPISDINEPFENSKYFDGFNVRYVYSSKMVYEKYLEPLSLTEEDCWITNTVKCFLFQDKHVTAYKDIGAKGSEGLKPTRDLYFDAARPCVQKWLKFEIEMCDPQLIIALGREVCQMIHADANFKEADSDVFGNVRGKLLNSGINNGKYKRHPIFANRNVICLFHPHGLGYKKSDLKAHETEHIPLIRDFLTRL